MKKKIYKIIIGLCVLLVIANVCSFFNIPFFGFKTYKVVTGSMEPYLHVNDIVIIKKTNNYSCINYIEIEKESAKAENGEVVC